MMATVPGRAGDGGTECGQGAAAVAELSPPPPRPEGEGAKWRRCVHYAAATHESCDATPREPRAPACALAHPASGLASCALR
jgi:hypothetical protein